MPPSTISSQDRIIGSRFSAGDLLGQTDHSSVYLAKKLDGDNRVALKLLASGTTAAQRQLQYWSSVRGLSHANLISLLGSGEDRREGKPVTYVAMEYADENLGSILSSRALTPEETRELISPVVEALSYLHAHGFAHGRLKPANVLAVNDRLKIASDGLVPLGSSPDATASQDVFLLGATLFEALTQKKLGPANQPTTTEKDLAGFAPPLRDIVSGCLQSDPNKRWTLDKVRAAIAPGWQPSVAGPSKAASVAPAPIAPEKRPAQVASTVSPQKFPTGIFTAVAIALVAVIGFFAMHKGLAPASSPAPVQSQSASTSAPANGDSVATPPSDSGNSTGGIVHQQDPDVSASALHTIHGTIKVRIAAEVGSDGKIAKTRMVNSGSSKFFARKASEAAQQWQFAANGPSHWMIEFQFKRSGVTSHAEPAQR